MASDAFQLNEHQVAVVEASVDARLLVIAGAGQGKTEVVASRIDSLVKDYDLSASEEILVLSFSRAAVSAVKSRLTLRDVACPNVRTFDSFANYLLLEADIEPAGSFDARIRRATKVLVESDEVPDVVASLQHVVIDEVQDLVGDRADFVLALLERLDKNAGITALGDPLQGVYDFVLEESLSDTTSDDFFEALKDVFNCETAGLGRNYRAQGDDPRNIVELGNDLWELWENEEGYVAESFLDEAVGGLDHLGHIGKWHNLVPCEGKTTAILCATNADALRVSRFLRWKKVPHAVRRHAQDFGAARWIAEALGPLPGPKERRSEIEAALETILDETARDGKWNELKALEGRAGDFDALDLVRVHKRIRAGAIPLPLTEPDHSAVIVSTIHRAKGLEFDRVFVVKPTWEPDDEDSWTRVRRDYVALSRARETIVICEYGRPKASIAEYRGRFYRRKKNWKTKRLWTQSMEFQYGDVETDAPVSTEGIDPRDVQSVLASDNLVGARLQLHLDEATSTGGRPAYLLVTDDGRLVGRTNDHFNDEFVQAFGCRKGYPRVVDGLTLVSIETVAGDPRCSERAGLGTAGFWLVARAAGLASPDWSNVKGR
ncbi:UvrD-helicase domain-containing protein [[Mycobacterium] kokjensenii]|uniref:UvrD-helicase domain-containing protein n=1 Tax=[Mycobacterium] kokjensenii TaxID=3064287 RepID=UPI0035A146E8